MTLRTRLLLALIGLVALALVVADVVTYTQLRSFLLTRLDPQLQVASFTMVRALESDNHVPGAYSFPGANGAGGPHFPGSQVPPYLRPNFRPHAFDVEPAGSFGQLLDARGARVGKTVTVVGSGKAPPVPTLSVPPPAIGSSGYVIFSASATGAGAVSYRVLERPLGFDSLRIAVGIPLSDVNDTLNRLLLVEVLVSVVVLGVLGVVSLVMVRRELRPLEDMARTAGEISHGALGRRVTPADDRTEVGRLGLALNAMLSEIENAFAARAASEDRLRRFLADASHELRTPLTSIRGYAELFDLGAKENPADLATSMRHIRDEADRMSVLVDDLLLLARLGRERPLALAPDDVVAVVRRAVESARMVAPDRSVTLEAPAHEVVPCDPARIRQVVDNLVGNALRHSPPGQPVEVSVVPEEASVVLTVRDHGPGVPPEEAERIFTPFHRSDFARARSDGGAGLGLAIVAAITAAHGGTVGVRTAAGGGAEFWVRLPRTGLAGSGAATGEGAVRNGATGADGSSGTRQVEERNNTAASV